MGRYYTVRLINRQVKNVIYGGVASSFHGETAGGAAAFMRRRRQAGRDRVAPATPNQFLEGCPFERFTGQAKGALPPALTPDGIHRRPLPTSTPGGSEADEGREAPRAAVSIVDCG